MSLRIAFARVTPDRAFDIEIDAPSPGVTVLFGPSGAGKSTIALVVAGLLRPAKVYVEIDGAVLADSAARVFVPPERRRIGTVFQDSRLFPHLSVAGNLNYGLKRAFTVSHAIEWHTVIDLLGLGALLDRRPDTLSGGERQRVAIGRALLSQPRLLVVDEPLASLDAPRRAEILPYLASLRQRLAMPILYVTHALDEVARLADTVALISGGRCTAIGPLSAISARADLPFGTQPGGGAVLQCRLAGHLPQRRLTRLALDGPYDLELLVPLCAMQAGAAVRLLVPAAEVILATDRPNGISVQNVLAARVTAIVAEASGSALVELRLGDARLLARVTHDAVQRLGLQPGGEVLALIKSVAIAVLT